MPSSWPENVPDPNLIEATWDVTQLHRPTNLHMCTAQTCIPSTSSGGASLCGSLALEEKPPFPLH